MRTQHNFQRCIVCYSEIAALSPLIYTDEQVFYDKVFYLYSSSLCHLYVYVRTTIFFEKFYTSFSFTQSVRAIVYTTPAKVLYSLSSIYFDKFSLLTV